MKARLWILGNALAVLLIGLMFWGQRETDPLYEGKPLSKYLESCHIDGIHHGGGLQGKPTAPSLGDVRVGDACEAILKEGTNAFPMLVRMLTWGETRVDQWRRVMVSKFGLPQRFMPTNWVAEWENQTRALVAFQVLGTNAAPATRRIVPLLSNSAQRHRLHYQCLQNLSNLALLTFERQRSGLRPRSEGKSRQSGSTSNAFRKIFQCGDAQEGTGGEAFGEAVGIVRFLFAAIAAVFHLAA